MQIINIILIFSSTTAFCMYFAKQDKRTPDVVKSQQPSNNASTTGQIHLKFDITDLRYVTINPTFLLHLEHSSV